MPEIGGLILSGCSARLGQSNRVFPSVAPDLALNPPENQILAKNSRVREDKPPFVQKLRH